MDLTESQFSECEGSSNFIPSSDSGPPPPVSYRVAEYKPGDIHINGSEVNTESASALDMSVNSSFEASDFEKKQGSFTQADDFQDLFKENEDPSKLKVDQSTSGNYPHGFRYNCSNRGGKSLGHTQDQDLFDEVPNHQHSMRLSEPLNTHKIITNSTNSPFLSGLVSHSSSLTRLPNSASVLLNSTDGGGGGGGDEDEEEGEDTSALHDHEISYNDDGENDGSSSIIMTSSSKNPVKQNLVKMNDLVHSTDSILAINVSAIVYRMDNTHNVIFDSRFNVKINNVNIEAAYHRLQKDNAKLIAELSCLLKPTSCSAEQVKTSDSLSSISPPITDSSSSHAPHAASSKSIFRSSSMSTSNSDFAQPKLDENQGSSGENHLCFPFKSPVRASSSGSELFIPRSKNKSNVKQLPKKKSPIRASTTSSSSSDLFIPRSANKVSRRFFLFYG
ncbi:unnamed protein product [Trichobilharzia szidati]|nr:unnamed protein product [Trichobilharzia szidati]